MIVLTVLLSVLAATAQATLIWDGRANNETTSAFLNNWSWSNQVGQYQYYIHGSGPVTEYVNLGTSYKNPADKDSKQGFKITIDNTSYWNGQTMRRTELIPQTGAPINKGKVYYHFSLQINSTNLPSPYEEHQICFFESHFTELKYGLVSDSTGPSDTRLQWMVSGTSQWAANLTASVWHNVAYAIDFDAQTVGFWHSTGRDALQLVASPVAVSASSDGQDWHLGVLRLPSNAGRTDDAPEDWHFSGVYVESGSLTTSVSGPGA